MRLQIRAHNTKWYKNNTSTHCQQVLDGIPGMVLSKQDRNNHREYWFLVVVFLCLFVCFLAGKVLKIIAMRPQFVWEHYFFLSGASACLHCLISSLSLFTSLCFYGSVPVAELSHKQITIFRTWLDSEMVTLRYPPWNIGDCIDCEGFL